MGCEERCCATDDDSWAFFTLSKPSHTVHLIRNCYFSLGFQGAERLWRCLWEDGLVADDSGFAVRKEQVCVCMKLASRIILGSLTNNGVHIGHSALGKGEGSQMFFKEKELER